jgi:hypothetical protein
MGTLLCLNCRRELAGLREVREIATPKGPHGPFCEACAQSAEGMPFDQWLDEQWQRQRPH